MPTGFFSQYFISENPKKIVWLKRYTFAKIFSEIKDKKTIIQLVRVAKVVERCVQDIFDKFEGFYFRFPECLICIIGIYNILAIPQ